MNLGSTLKATLHVYVSDHFYVFSMRHFRLAKREENDRI